MRSAAACSSTAPASGAPSRRTRSSAPPCPPAPTSTSSAGRQKVLARTSDEVATPIFKDKWRNLSFGAGQGSREKIRVPRITGPTCSSSASSPLLLLSAPSNKLTEASAPADDEKKLQDGKNLQKYGAMILEALSELNEPNGSEVTAILGFIEQRHEVQAQQNLRRVLTAKLRRLVDTKKVEKIDNKYYKLTDSFATKTPALVKALTQKQKDPSKPLKASKNLGIFAAVSPALEAAAAAAAKVADAESKAHLAHEHMMEAERILKMAEETESLLTLAAEIYDRCSRGEIITVNPVSQKEF